MGKTTKKLLVICGPTATGKTKLALHLAKIFDGILISADSRQVYKYMDVGTGKGDEKVLGYDLVRPDEEFSVSQYIKFANNAIRKIYKQNELPILVGGTGLYIKAVIDGIATITVAPDSNLRIHLQKKSTIELYRILKKIDPEKTDLMNESDRKNPRRLIRAIEVASSNTKVKVHKPDYDVLFVGLTMPKDGLKRRIEKRVEERIEKGFEKEMNFLKNKDLWKGAPSRTLGYKQSLSADADKDWINKWKLEEFKYAKRQMTWFKKDKRINWFNVGQSNWLRGVENLVQKWYDLDRNA